MQKVHNQFSIYYHELRNVQECTVMYTIYRMSLASPTYNRTSHYKNACRANQNQYSHASLRQKISEATSMIGHNSTKPNAFILALIKQDQSVLVHSFRFKLADNESEDSHNVKVKLLLCFPNYSIYF